MTTMIHSGTRMVCVSARPPQPLPLACSIYSRL